MKTLIITGITGMGHPGSCNTDSLLGNHPNKILNHEKSGL